MGAVFGAWAHAMNSERKAHRRIPRPAGSRVEDGHVTWSGDLSLSSPSSGWHREPMKFTLARVLLTAFALGAVDVELLRVVASPMEQECDATNNEATRMFSFCGPPPG